MKRRDLIGIVCSKDLSEAYCLIGSSIYIQMEDNNKLSDKKIVYIPHSMLNHLIHESFNGNKFKWNIEFIRTYCANPHQPKDF